MRFTVTRVLSPPAPGADRPAGTGDRTGSTAVGDNAVGDKAEGDNAECNGAEGNDAGGDGMDVGTNIWVVGDDDGLLVIDAGRDAAAVADAVRHRRVHAIVCTHGDEDHVSAAAELSGLLTAPVYLGAADRQLWDAVHPGLPPYDELRAGDSFAIAGQQLHVLPTPGHSPGGICLYAPGPGLLFSGDTLSRGGPGAPGRAARDVAALRESVRATLFTLPAPTVVHPGHGPDSTVGTEAARQVARPRSGGRIRKP